MRFENYTKNKETPALCHNRLNFIFYCMQLINNEDFFLLFLFLHLFSSSRLLSFLYVSQVEILNSALHLPH